MISWLMTTRRAYLDAVGPPRQSQQGMSAWLIAAVAVALGLAVARATRSDLTGLALAGVALIGVAGAILLARPVSALLVLIPWVAFQNVFVVEVGFFFLPAYVFSALLLARLAMTGDLVLKGEPFRVVWLLYLVALLSVPVAMLVDPHLPTVVGDPRFSAVRPLVQVGALLLVSSILFVPSSVAADARAIRSCLRVFVGLGVAVSAYALYQQVAYYFGLPILEELLPARRVAAAVSYTPQGNPIFRSNAVFLEPNGLGNFLLASLSISLTGAVARRNPTFGFVPPLGWFGIVIQAAGLVSTFSIGAFGGAVVVALILVSARGNRARLTAAISTTALAVVLSIVILSAVLQRNESVGETLVSRVEERLAVETAPAFAGNPYVGGRRVDYWGAGIELLSRYPLTGVGIGNFGPMAAATNPRLNYNAGSYGLLWAWIGEFGIAGLILYLIFVGGFLRFFWRAYRAGRNFLLLGFAAGFAGMMAQYFASGYTRLEIHIWLFLGLGVAAARVIRGTSDTRQQSDWTRRMLRRSPRAFQ
jgi:O-antigen ligase